MHQQQILNNLKRQFQQMSSPTVLLVLACLLLQICSQNANLYPNCAIIDVVNGKCLKCISDSFQISQDQCVATQVIKQTIFTPNINNQSLPKTALFYSQATTNQITQPTSQNQVMTQTPQPTLATTSSSPQSSNYLNILNLFQSLSSNSQNNQQTKQQFTQNNIFLPTLSQQNQDQQTPQSSTFQRGSYTDNNCKTVDETNARCIKCYQSYYVNQALQQCVPTNPLCQNATDQNQCTSCYTGYKLNNGNCELNLNSQPSNSDSTRDDNCKTWYNGICQQCYSGYYLNNTLNLCKVVELFCKTYNKEGKCITCYSGYQLNSTQGCSNKKDSSSSTNNTNFQSTTANSSNNVNSNLQTNFGNSNSLAGTNIDSTTSQIFANSISLNQGNCINITSNLFCTLGDFILQFKVLGTQKQLVNVVAINGATSAGNSQSNAGSGIYAFSSPASTSTSTSSPTFSSTSESNISQKCYERQVSINGKCQNVSNDCKSWNQLGGCTECYRGYQVINGACKIA